MLLKCCVIILILVLSIVSCVMEIEPGSKNNSTSNVISNTTVSRRTRELMRKTPLGSKINRLITKTELKDHIGRFLEEYTILTKDNYILSIFRLTYENSEAPSNRFPVLLVHGMFQSSDRFLQQSEKRSLALKLQDFGYDVWLANARGNKYGRRHAYLDPEENKKEFFNYTYEEIGLYDVSATVDFILFKTKFKKVHYIGFSLGGTSFLVLNSREPSYNEKFLSAYLLAPIGYQKFFPNSDLEIEARRCDEIYENTVNQGAVEIFPYGPTSKHKLFRIGECLGNETYENICRQLKIDESMGIKTRGNKLDDTRGGSIKQLVHLAQNVRSKTFSQWDYGEKKNEDLYGTKEAPKYNLSLITAATTIIYAANDEFVSPKDIDDLAGDMVNAITKEVGRKDFRHQDFIVAPDVMEMLYGDIIKELEEYNKFRNTNHNLKIARRNNDKNKNKHNNTGESNATSTEKDEDEANEQEENPDWIMVSIGPLALFLGTLFLIMFIKTVTFEFFIAL